MHLNTTLLGFRLTDINLSVKRQQVTDTDIRHCSLAFEVSATTVRQWFKGVDIQADCFTRAKIGASLGYNLVGPRSIYDQRRATMATLIDSGIQQDSAFTGKDKTKTIYCNTVDKTGIVAHEVMTGAYGRMLKIAFYNMQVYYDGSDGWLIDINYKAIGNEDSTNPMQELTQHEMDNESDIDEREEEDV